MVTLCMIPVLALLVVTVQKMLGATLPFHTMNVCGI